MAAFRIVCKTSDTMLKDQFKIFSSRSILVVQLTQKCLNHIAKGDLISNELHSSIEQLLSLKLEPEPGDPLHDILQYTTSREEPS